MATPVVQSVGTGTGGAATTVVITKPTGLTAGDLMVAIVGTQDTGAANVPSDESGWTTIGSQAQSLAAMKAYYKVASAGDAAASNFTFDTGSTCDSLRGIIYRITGFSPTGTIGDYEFNTLNTATTTPSFTTTVSPRTSDALLIMAVTVDQTSVATFSGYTISGTNPTWTERDDTTVGNLMFASANATANSAAQITSYGVTMSVSNTKYVGLLMSLPAQQSATVTPASIALVGDNTDPTVKAAVSFAVDSVSLGSAVGTPTTRAEIKRWSDQEKGSGTWTNQTKS